MTITGDPSCNYNPKPHALCLPFPAQSHIKAMLKLSKLLHHKGFHITFVNTEFNHKRFLKSTNSLDPDSLRSLGFRFETIPDGLPPNPDPDATQDIPSLCDSTRKNFAGPFLELVNRINDDARASGDIVVSGPPVSCLVADGFMSLAVGSAAQVVGVPLVKFFPIGANGLVGFQQFRPLLERGIIPAKATDQSCLENTFVEWVPGMKGLRMRDLPSFWRATDSDDLLLNFCKELVEIAFDCSAIVIQTYDALEKDVLGSLAEKVPHLHTVSPLELLLKRLPNDPLEVIPYSLWKEEADCLKWLDSQKRGSVIYVNFGSVVVLTPQQVVDIRWGLAKRNHPFLWVIRPDLVMGESACLSREYLAEIEGRSLITSWCPQEEVLNHPSVGGFLTHCGWNSVIESMTSGVPLLCLPFFAEQQTNCWLTCNGLGVGLEIDMDVKRDQVEGLVRDLMEGEKGKEMRKKALELKKSAEEATSPHGSSYKNFDNLVNNVLLQKLAG